MAGTARGSGGGDYSGGAVAVTIFAGILMMLGGAFHALQGFVALASDTFFVVSEGYVFELDVTTWGWVHLILGVVVALAGFSLFRARTWARTVAVVVASLSMIASFLWMPFYPFWSLILVALDLYVIWAVTVHGTDITKP